VNKLRFSVIVMEGNAGIERPLKVLDPEDKFVISADPNVTYREYILIKLPDNKKLRLLSSDDIQEFERIEIIETGSGEFDWRGFKSGASKVTEVQEQGESEAPKKSLKEKLGHCIIRSGNTLEHKTLFLFVSEFCISL
jgi:hypothetical protein